MSEVLATILQAKGGRATVPGEQEADGAFCTEQKIILKSASRSSIIPAIPVTQLTGMRGDMVCSPPTHLDKKFSATEKKVLI